MNVELGIGARKITISTVGVVPSIKKLIKEDMQVRLAISLHCSNDEERTALLPANKRYGGLSQLMNTVREYINTTNRRITFEWALIENQNDTPYVARQLGHLITKEYNIRKAMVHINLIPLNPTGGFEGGPSAKKNVDQFIYILEHEFGLTATPRVRRGIDINAGCGQLKATIQKKEKQMQNNEEDLQSFIETATKSLPIVGVYEDNDDDDTNDNFKTMEQNNTSQLKQQHITTIVNEELVMKANKRRRKLLKHLKSIKKLKDLEYKNDEQIIKINKENDFALELESIEHNLK